MATPVIDERAARTALIQPHVRRWALLAIAIAVAVAVVLAAIVWHGTSTSFDTWVFERAYRPFGAQDSDRRRAWLLFTEPAVSLGVPVLVAVWAAVTRRWRVLALAAFGPAIALGVTELIGKPLVDRILGPGVLVGDFAGAVHGSYPSGHETGVVSWLTLIVLMVLREVSSRRRRIGTVVVAVLWALAGALGLTINYYHYATDTIGAIGVAVAVVLGTALAVDAVAPRVSARWRRVS